MQDSSKLILYCTLAVQIPNECNSRKVKWNEKYIFTSEISYSFDKTASKVIKQRQYVGNWGKVKKIK